MAEYEWDPQKVDQQRVFRNGGWVALGVFVLVLIVTSFYMVDTDEQGVVLRFGKFARLAKPGLHAKLPLWIEVVKTPKVERVFKEEFGFRTLGAGVDTVYSPQKMDNESLMLTYSRFHSDFLTHFPGKVRSLGSSVAHIAYVARGAACGAVLGNVHVWDVAAGQVILQAAGGSIRDLSGKTVEISNYLGGEKIDRVLVAAAKGQHKEIISTLAAR